MAEQKEEGIVLKATPYQESSRILSLFTKNSGIISVIAKRLSPKKSTLINLTTPLCRAEFIYRKGKSSLYRFIDGSILDLHLPLRQSYLNLKTASNLLNLVSASQLPEKPAPHLYQLLSLSLKKMPLFSDPSVLFSAFQLKLLKHEGLLSIGRVCNRCQQNPPKYLHQGEGICVQCEKGGRISFSEKEWQTLLDLLSVRSFEALTAIELSSHLQKKIINSLQTV